MNNTTFINKDVLIYTLLPSVFRKCFSLLITLFIIQIAHAQLIYQESFDFPPAGAILPAGWTAENLADAGPGPIPTNPLWRLRPSGTASGGAYWEDRQAIQSPSGGGAIVFDSDFLDNGGVINANCDTNVLSCAPHEGTIISPSFSTVGFPSITLKYYQYYRGFDSETFVDISTNGGATWDSIAVNRDISETPFGGETERFDPQTINISTLAGDQPDVRIRFRFRGAYYFWIIDDLSVFSASVDDIAMDEILWPKADLPCYLGADEQVSVRLLNLGQFPLGNFDVQFTAASDSGFTGQITESYQGNLLPNESQVFRFQTRVDLRGLRSLRTRVIAAGDGNTVNDSLEFAIEFPCNICTDTAGREYICDEIVVQFDPQTDSTQKKEIRQIYNNATRIDVCGCDSLAVWRIELPMEVDGDSLFSPEATSRRLIQEPEIEEAGVNHIVDLKEQGAPAGSFPFFGPKLSTSTDTITVAILDTGFDFDHDSIKNRFWKNQGELVNSLDTDSDKNCFPMDVWGVNIVDPSSLPDDDHPTGHGTHVGGTVLNAAPACIYNEIMVVKIVAQNGRGRLFDMECGMKYARDHGADIINVSMGYQGEQDSVLSDVIASLDSAGILLITSAGNDSTDNLQEPHWPSNFTTIYKNVLSVTSVDSLENLSSFANSGVTTVDIAAKGELVEGPIPGNTLEFKSGTSMAAALVSRIASFYWSDQLSGGVTYLDVKNFILGNAKWSASISGSVRDGNVLNDDLTSFLGSNCLVSIDQELLTDIVSYPNPFDRQVSLSFELDQPKQVDIHVFNQMGQLIHRDQSQAPTGKTIWTWETPDLAQGLYVYHMLLDGQLAYQGKWIRL